MDLMVQKYRFGKKDISNKLMIFKVTGKKGRILPLSSLLAIFGKTE